MAQCQRVVNGELLGVSGKSLETQTLHTRSPAPCGSDDSSKVQSGSYQSFSKCSHCLCGKQLWGKKSDNLSSIFAHCPRMIIWEKQSTNVIRNIV